MPNKTHIDILGGGPAGLAAGFYAAKQQLSFTVHEASNGFGGNAQTFRKNEFLYDSGAHRFHDKIPDVTQDILNLMGKDMQSVSAPSQIIYDNKFIRFPLSPLDLFKKLGIKDFSKASFSVLGARLKSQPETYQNFKEKVLANYGAKIANTFLIPYSEKLWGLPADQLSPDISGGRLKGLNLKTFFLDTIRKNNSRHLDGSFYYPELGIGQIFDKIIENSHPESFKTGHRITGITHENNRITGFQINDGNPQTCDRLVSTLPLTVLLRILNPAPPAEVLQLAQSLQFRDVTLITFFINKPSITNNATLYFPKKDFPFTRAVEPKNRSAKMSPNDKTSLVIEIPHHTTYGQENAYHEEELDNIEAMLVSTGIIEKKEIFDREVRCMRMAYPILDTHYKKVAAQLFEYIHKFSNLHIVGRNGLFEYSHIHNLLSDAKELMNKIS